MIGFYLGAFILQFKRCVARRACLLYHQICIARIDLLSQKSRGKLLISLFPGFDNIWFALGESRFNNPGLQMPELMSRTWANSGVVR